LLVETNLNCSSYGLFKAKDKKLLDRDDLALRLDTAEKINHECVLLSILDPTSS